MTSIHEDVDLIPGPAQWVKDLGLLWLWHRLAAAAPIWPRAWELPYVAGAAQKERKKGKGWRKEGRKKCSYNTPMTGPRLWLWPEDTGPGVKVSVSGRSWHRFDRCALGNWSSDVDILSGGLSYPRFFGVCLFVFVCFVFLGLHLWHMEVPRLESESELQLPNYTTTTATLDPSHIFDLHCNLQQRPILKPTKWGQGSTLHPHRDNIGSFTCWATMGTPRACFLNFYFNFVIFVTYKIIDILGVSYESKAYSKSIPKIRTWQLFWCSLMASFDIMNKIKNNLECSFNFSRELTNRTWTLSSSGRGYTWT